MNLNSGEKLFFVLICLIGASISTYIDLEPIDIDEELDSNHLVANLARLLSEKFANEKINVSYSNLKMLPTNQEINDYFKLILSEDLKHAEIKTSSKRLDREYLCRSIRFCECEATCRLDLKLSMENLQFKLPVIIKDINDNSPSFYQPEIQIDIDLDNPSESWENFDGIVQIPLKLGFDLDSTSQNRIQSYSITNLRPNESQISNELKTISVKHSVKSNSSSNEYLWLNVNASEELKKIVHAKGKDGLLNERYQLRSFDTKFEGTQEILIRFKSVMMNQISNSKTPVTNTVSEEIKKTAHFGVNIVSALNDLEICENSTNKILELKFKKSLINDVKSVSNNNNNNNNTFTTLAYLIGEQSGKKMAKKKFSLRYEMSEELPIELFKFQEMRNGLYAIKLNNLYIEPIKRFHNLKQTENFNEFYLKLNLTNESAHYSSVLAIKLPVDIFTETSVNYLSTVAYAKAKNEPSLNVISIFSSVVIVSTASVVVILFGLACFIISISFYVSNKCRKNKSSNEEIKSEKNEKNLFYSSMDENSTVKSDQTSLDIGPTYDDKRKEESLNNSPKNSIMVYDVMPNREQTFTVQNGLICRIYQKNDSNTKADNSPPVYSLSTSSSNMSSNNISPVTTTTTSIGANSVGLLEKASNSELGTQLDPKFLKDNTKINEWFLNTIYYPNNKGESHLKVEGPQDLQNQTEHVNKPKISSVVDEESSSGVNTSSSLLESSSSVDYKNEIYRNSHLVFKSQYTQVKKQINNTTNGASSSSSSSGSNSSYHFEPISTYEARPIILNGQIDQIDINSILTRPNNADIEQNINQNNNLNKSSFSNSYIKINRKQINVNMRNQMVNSRLNSTIDENSFIKGDLDVVTSGQVSCV